MRTERSKGTAHQLTPVLPLMNGPVERHALLSPLLRQFLSVHSGSHRTLDQQVLGYTDDEAQRGTRHGRLVGRQKLYIKRGKFRNNCGRCAASLRSRYWSLVVVHIIYSYDFYDGMVYAA